jgi:hypothetical protein
MYHSVSAFGSSIGTEILSSFGAAMVGVYCSCRKLLPLLNTPPKCGGLEMGGASEDSTSGDVCM